MPSHATENSLFHAAEFNPLTCFGLEMRKHGQQDHLELFDRVFPFQKPQLVSIYQTILSNLIGL